VHGQLLYNCNSQITFTYHILHYTRSSFTTFINYILSPSAPYSDDQHQHQTV
jgi:hypothetical protein